MEPLYKEDLAYIQSADFGGLARGAAPAIMQTLKSASIPIRHVVEAGCGAGPLTVALTESGFTVTAIDVSAELLAIARQAAPEAKFVHASVYDAEFPACEAIIALGEPLTYHAEPENADGLVLKFFQRSASALPIGGMLIFDTIELGDPSLTGRTWSAGDDWAVLVETQEDLNAFTLVRNIETFRRVGDSYRRGREIHRVRLFETVSLLNQLESCGFTTETAQSYGGQKLAPRRRVFFSTRVRPTKP